MRSIAAHRNTLSGVCPSLHVSVYLSSSHAFLVVTDSDVSQVTHAFLGTILCRLQSIAAHRDPFFWRLSVRLSVCLSGSHTFLVVTYSDVSQAMHAFLGMLQFWSALVSHIGEDVPVKFELYAVCDLRIVVCHISMSRSVTNEMGRKVLHFKIYYFMRIGPLWYMWGL